MLSLDEMMQIGIVPSISKERIKRVLATDGTNDPIEGPCVFFLRPNVKKNITTSNISDVCYNIIIIIIIT